MPHHRKHERIPASIPVTISLRNSQKTIEAYIENISLGGAFVSSDLELEMGEKISQRNTH